MTEQIKIELVDVMGNDLTTVNAARVSYGAWSTNFGDRDQALVEFLAEHGHVTPFRHAQITLRCKAPIFLARQLGKHQVGFSWNELSRRYKDGDAIEVEFYEPRIILERPDNLMKGTAVSANAALTGFAKQGMRNGALDALALYKRLLEHGVAPEHARMVLPQSMMTEWIRTGSLFGFASLYRQRSDLHAQLEARIFAKQLDEIMSELFPICWKALIK